MKKSILILCAAFALTFVGCNKGGTSDQYNTSTSSSTNLSPTITDTNTSLSTTNTFRSTNTIPPTP